MSVRVLHERLSTPLWRSAPPLAGPSHSSGMKPSSTTARLSHAPQGRRWNPLLAAPAPRLANQPPLPFLGDPVSPPNLQASPEVKVITLSLVAAVVEVLCGRRPPHQLLQWASPAVADHVEQLCTPHQTRDWRLRSLRAQQPTDHTVEVTVHLAHTGRSRAAALQLSRRQGRWEITELCLAPQHQSAP